MKVCRVCGSEFDKGATGRLRVLKKERKGESVVWICPGCADRIGVSGYAGEDS